MRIRSHIIPGLLVPLVGIIATACGSSSSQSHTKSVAAAATTVSAPHPPTAHLRILSPRPGAHTGRTVIVHLRLAGGGSPGPRAFVYRLDRQRPQRAGALFTLRHLHPGHHRLVINFDNGAKATAAISFTVKAPKPPAAAAPTAASAPAPTTSTAAAPPATTPTTPPPPPATSTTTASPPPPPPASGIPQHNGGDGDSDNNGGPSDGDGNI